MKHNASQREVEHQRPARMTTWLDQGAQWDDYLVFYEGRGVYSLMRVNRHGDAIGELAEGSEDEMIKAAQDDAERRGIGDAVVFRVLHDNELRQITNVGMRDPSPFMRGSNPADLYRKVMR